MSAAASPGEPDGRSAGAVGVSGGEVERPSVPSADRLATGAIVVVAVAVWALYARQGSGWVLDDWYTLANAHFDGALAAAGPDQRSARPGAWLTYAVVFGLLGDHPAAVLALQGAIGAATAIVLDRLLRHVLPRAMAATAAVVWLVLPNHTSLEVWASATNIGLALLLGLAGLLVLQRAAAPPPVAATPPARWPVLGLGGALVAASVLTYEAVAPGLAVAALALPWIERGRPARSSTASAWAGIAVAAAWVILHWHPDKDARPAADLSQALGAHFGWGIAPPGRVSEVVAGVALLGVLVVAVRLVLSSTRPTCGAPEWTVVGGLLVVALGTLPFARYFYAPLGAGDRMTVVSGVGGALVWTGLGAMAWRWWRPLAVLGAVGLAVVSVAARVERADRWHRAAADARAVLDEIGRRHPEPPGSVVHVGPHPVQEQNVAAFLDRSNIEKAVQLHYDDESVEAVMVYDAATFASLPAEQRIDIVALSQLRDDAYGPEP